MQPTQLINPELRKASLAILASILAASLLLGSIPGALALPKDVEFTWTIAALGEGAWGCGALFDDGSAKGNLPIEFGHGFVVGILTPVSWSQSNGFVEICFEVKKIIRDPIGALVADCIPDIPITGIAIIVPDFGGMGPHIVRVTPA